MPEICEETRIVAAENHVSCDLDGEAAILSVDRGVYYGLNKTSARIWRAIEQPVPVATVRDALVDEYDVDVTRCTNDLIAVIEQMVCEELIKIAE